MQNYIAPRRNRKLNVHNQSPCDQLYVVHERFCETILSVNMRDRMFNFNPKRHALIIECFRYKLVGIIQSYRPYLIIRVVSSQLNDLGEEFSKSSILGGQ